MGRDLLARVLLFVNRRDVLVGRARECELLRGRRVNLLASIPWARPMRGEAGTATAAG